ncbi:MAG: CotH kinase family protein, partial [Bacteroidales bacterium]|nr:CotH kinase family protein [Bacteroidales bacterium]
DELYDEPHKFKSAGFNLPVQIKSPNDTLPDEQFNYIKTFINEMEAEIKKIGSSNESRYTDYLDINTFADWWLVLETISNYEAYKPRSVKFYKGRDGVDSAPGTVCKLKAGPLWDQELFLVDKKFNSKDMYYFKYLFRDPVFVETVKKRWEVYKGNILGNGKYPDFVEYMEDIVSLIKESANRDIALWENPYFTLSSEVQTVRRGFHSKIEWMDSQIKAL